MARPQKYTDQQIITALKKTKGMVYLAAKTIGCEADTIYIRAKKSKKVAAAMKSERGELLDTTELKLYSAIMNGEAWAVQFTLRTIGKERGYSEKVIVSGDPESPLKHDHTGTVTTRIEQLAAAFEEAADREETGTVSGDRAGKSVDTGEHQGRAFS